MFPSKNNYSFPMYSVLVPMNLGMNRKFIEEKKRQQDKLGTSGLVLYFV